MSGLESTAPPRLTASAGGALAGVRDSAPAGLAAIPLGLALGVLVTQAGLDWWWATIFAAVVFAGSFEFLLLGLVTAGTPLASIAATAFIVNLRHAFYALTFPLHRLPPLARAYGTFALTDEAWALTAHPAAQAWRARRILALQAAFHLTWVASVTIGAFAGTLVPEWLHGLDFALTALFVVLGIDAFRARRDVPAPLVATACAAVSALVLGEGMLVGAMALYVGYLTVRFAARRRAERHA